MSNSFNGRDSVHSFSSSTLFSCLFLLLATAVLVIPAQTVPPVLDLRFIGNGTVTAVNNAGAIVGYRTVGSTFQPLVSVDGQPFAPLPAPAGSMTTFPTDINNNGVIVGVSYSPQWVAVAVRWTPETSGYVLQVLPRISNDPTSFATAINDVGKIVGSRSNLGYQPTGQGWVYSDSAGFTALASYGFWIVPRDINNSGIIVGGQERLNLVTGQVDVTGQGPANYNDITSTAINASGMIAGSSTLRSTSLNIVSVFRRGLDGIWTFIAGSSRYTSVQGINSLGDIGYGELGAGVYLDGLGTFPVWSLLDPAVTSAGWTITGNGAFINDSRQIVTIGRNTVSGENGVVLLSPTGTLPPPTAPTGLDGVAHPGTRMEPYNSIDLNWANTSPLTNGYELQRSVAGRNEWVTLSLTPPGTPTHHSDTTVGVNITYDYRIRAVGIGGPSPWSNIATVTSPATPLDITPPEVVLLEPSEGANVSGIVPVRALATDNVAVEYQEISFWNQYSGQQVVIGSTDGGGELSLNWDTSQLVPATYKIRAYAYDTLGNWNQSEVNVVVGTSVSTVMRVSEILLTAVNVNGITVFGKVKVRDAASNPVPDAAVEIIWSTPNGGLAYHSSQTNRLGVASFSVNSIPGKYRLTVTNVVKSGVEFDRPGSQLTAVLGGFVTAVDMDAASF
ncbi:MAG: hypothetical protein IPL32_08315 [Chloracidobacterium sp.]|nr:hypothetical protein [Chloracidobacterium sp.]